MPDDPDRKARVRKMFDIIPEGWDRRPLQLAEEIAELLAGVKDEGTVIDTGTDGASADLYVFVQGVEYWINIRKSYNQLVKEGVIPPPPKPEVKDA